MERKLNKEAFVERSRKVHGDKYDYTKVEYLNNFTKVCIVCPEHGEFWQAPMSHMAGHGCPACAGLKKRTTETFVEKAREVHGDKYDYSKTIYVNKRTKVIITCPIHGDFEQCANNHLRGQGCPMCGNDKAIARNGDYKNARKTKEIFQQELNELYDGQYELLSEYKNNKSHIEVFCHKIGRKGREHGIFITRPDSLTNGHGCPKCSRNQSNGETEVAEFIKEIYKGRIVVRDRIVLKGKEMDIYLPDVNLSIEYNGAIWHSEKYSDDNEMVDKLNKCEANNIRLLNIFDDEWNNKKDICKSRIKSIMGLNKKIYARMCTLKEITHQEANRFMDENHLQGGVASKYNVALYYEDSMVAVMMMSALRKNMGGRNRDGFYEMVRFCSKKDLEIVGGASRLLSFFIKKYSPQEIVSYADRRWSQGRMYEKLGFEKMGNTKPGYFYITNNGQKKMNRFSLRKDILVSKYNCPIEMTERDFCHQLGFYRVYDCGTVKYIWKNK